MTQRHPELEALLEARTSRMIDDLRAAVQIESVSGSGHPDLTGMARWLQRRLEPLLDRVDLVPQDGAPDAVLGTVDPAAAPSGRRILLYSHYDVQPVAPREAWRHDPFGGVVEDGRMVGRGVVDDKADILARIHALEIWRELGRELPCGLVWLSEGAEEVGSPGLRDLTERHLRGLGIDGCVWESYLRDEDGTPEIAFGCRGLVYVELGLQTLRVDQHSSFATIFRSATGEMVQALGSITDGRGRCLIEGFHDDVRPFSPADLELIDAEAVPAATGTALDQVSPYLPGSEQELRRSFALEPTCNVDGVRGGSVEADMQTVLAGQATAKVDLRIVPDQDPARVVHQLRRHLVERGHQDITLRVLAEVPAHRSPTDSALGRAVAAAAEEVMGPPRLRPIIPGTGPLGLVAGALGVPAVIPPGAFRMSSNVHAPNENLLLTDYLDAVRFNIGLLERLADL